MLVLVLSAGPGRYGIRCREVVEVVSWQPLRHATLAPVWVSGFLEYRMEVVPVIDLVRLLSGRPCSPRRSTRIIVADHARTHRGLRRIGLLAERVVEVIDAEEDYAPGLVRENARFLGGLSRGADAYEIVDVGQLLPDAVDDLLFGPDGAPAVESGGP